MAQATAYWMLFEKKILVVIEDSNKNEICGKISDHISPYQVNEISLKELYTSISTLAQKLVLTLLNNEFILKI